MTAASPDRPAPDERERFQAWVCERWGVRFEDEQFEAFRCLSDGEYADGPIGFAWQAWRAALAQAAAVTWPVNHSRSHEAIASQPPAPEPVAQESTGKQWSAARTLLQECVSAIHPTLGYEEISAILDSYANLIANAVVAAPSQPPAQEMADEPCAGCNKEITWEQTAHWRENRRYHRECVPQEPPEQEPVAQESTIEHYVSAAIESWRLQQLGIVSGVQVIWDPEVDIPADGTPLYAAPVAQPPAEWLDAQDFYEVMQQYRHSYDSLDPARVTPAEAFGQVKTFIRAAHLGR